MGKVRNIRIKYDSKRFNHYRERRYKNYLICQLEGCERPVKRFGKYRRNKYCCIQHAKRAKNIYKRLWELKNRDKVKKYKEKHLVRKLAGLIEPHKIRRKKRILEKNRIRRVAERAERKKRIYELIDNEQYDLIKPKAVEEIKRRPSGKKTYVL